MIIGHLVHARMVFPGNINKFVNPSDEPKEFSYHIMKDGKEIAIRYSAKEAETACSLLKAETFEERRIFRQFPTKEAVANKLAA